MSKSPADQFPLDEDAELRTDLSDAEDEDSLDGERLEEDDLSEDSAEPEGEPKTRYRAIVAYDGTDYLGFQRQPETPTVQGEIEKVLSNLVGEPVKIIHAARTDAGVHAMGNVIAFDMNWRHDDNKLIDALNALLPLDIAIRELKRAEPNFHPRYDAFSRTYEYAIYETYRRNPLIHRQMWQLRGPFNLDWMNEAAAFLLGQHDFASLGRPTKKGTVTIRTVYQSEWRVDQITGGQRLIYRVEANAFLYHMVRVMVGAMVDVGRGYWSVTRFTDSVKVAQRKLVRQMAPPMGLTLTEVTYKTGGEDAPRIDNGDSVQ